jgi:curved DNA-binding protein CbpA
MSLYDDLGVSPDATPEQLSAAYRAAAKKHHPDAGGDPEAFAKVGHAIAILRDPKRRAEYDRSGQEDFTDNHPDAEARSYLMGEFSQHWGAFLNAQISDWINIADMVRSGLTRRSATNPTNWSRPVCWPPVAKALGHGWYIKDLAQT